MRSGSPRVRPDPRPGSRAALTIVELLVAMVVSLLLVLAVLQAFQVVAATITESRAVLELAGRLRGVTTLLQQDLDGITVPVRPWPSSSTGWGYFEYFDGPSRDSDSDANGTVDIAQDTNSNGIADMQEGLFDASAGDIDDILMFTSRREGLPYQGRIRATMALTSSGPFSYLGASASTAEVIWWTGYDDVNANNRRDPGERLSLHRRALLIRPDLNDSSTGLLYPVGNLVQAYAELKLFVNDNDISVRVQSDATNPNVYGLAANSLADLMNRNHRFAHVPSTFLSPPVFYNGQPLPFAVLDMDVVLYRLLSPAYRQSGDFEGEDVTLTNVLAFDVRAWDPDAPLLAGPSSDVVAPGDPGWPVLAVNPLPKIGAGAYVDLNYDTNTVRRSLPLGNPGRLSALSGVPVFFDTSGNGSWDVQPPAAPSFGERPAGAPGAFVLSTNPLQMWFYGTYDTWSTHYESDGLDQDGNGVADQGSDGFDNDGLNGVDDPGERESSPPYPVPLRGLEVLVRTVEPDMRQVRQATITADFVDQ